MNRIARDLQVDRADLIRSLIAAPFLLGGLVAGLVLLIVTVP